MSGDLAKCYNFGFHIGNFVYVLWIENVSFYAKLENQFTWLLLGNKLSSDSGKLLQNLRIWKYFFFSKPGL